MALIAPNHIEAGTGRLLSLETATDQGADSGKYLFAAGDVLYSKIRPSLAKVVLAPCDGLCSADMYPLKARAKLSEPFLKWFLLSTGFTAWATVESDRVAMPKINREKLNELPIAVPLRSEQTAIAAFLDRETAKIDALVDEQRRLIELLKEKRQAVISHAVTKGLDPTAPMKDSGVEWLGEVPAHWEVKPLRYAISKIESGVSVNAIDTPAETGELAVLKTSSVYTGNFDPTENKAVVLAEYDRVACPVRAGTLILSRMNTPELVGAAGLVHKDEPDIFLPDRLWQIHFSTLDAAFVHYWTQTDSYRGQIKSACAGTSSSMQNIAQDQLKSFWVAYPPVAEQTEIVGFLNRRTSNSDALRLEAESAVALLQERRAALISAAVTGKIDVRGLVKPEMEAA